MSRTDLRVDLPTGSWLGDVSQRVPAATLRVAETIAVDGSGVRSDGSGVRSDGSGVRSDGSGVRSDDSGVRSDGAGQRPTDGDPKVVATVRVAGTDRDRVEAALRSHDRVSRVTTVERRGDVRTLRVVARAPAYLPAARAVGLPIESTVQVVDGRAAVTVVGDRSRIEAFGRRLAGGGMTVGVAATGNDASDRTLTEAQRDLVFEGVRAGYYDTPRRCTLTELAEANGIAKSTCSETLHRAEGRVMRRFVDGEGPFASESDARAAGGRTSDEPDADEFDATDREEPVRSAATEP